MKHLKSNPNSSPVAGADADAIGVTPNMTASVPQCQHVMRSHDSAVNTGDNGICGMLRTCATAAILAICTLFTVGGLTGCGGGDKGDGGNGSQNSERTAPEELPRGCVLDFGNGVRWTIITEAFLQTAIHYENTNPSNGWPTSEQLEDRGAIALHYTYLSTGITEIGIVGFLPRGPGGEQRFFQPKIALTNFLKSNGNFVGCTATITGWLSFPPPSDTDYQNLVGQTYTITFSGTLPSVGTEGNGGATYPPYSNADVDPSLYGSFNLVFTNATGENLPFLNGESKSIEISFPNTLKIGERILEGHTKSEYRSVSWTVEWTDGELVFCTKNALFAHTDNLHLYVFRHGAYIGEFIPASEIKTEPTVASFCNKLYTSLYTREVLVNKVPENLIHLDSGFGNMEGSNALPTNEIWTLTLTAADAERHPYNKFGTTGDTYDSGWSTDNYYISPCTEKYRKVYHLDLEKKNITKIDIFSEVYLDGELIWKTYEHDDIFSVIELK